MKIKVGTQLERETLHRLKMAAAEDRRALGDVIQAAADEYLRRRQHLKPFDGGLRRLMDTPDFPLADKRFRASMEEDFWAR